MMRTLPFDLAAALAGAPVVDREGNKVIELHLFKTVTKYPIVAIIDKHGDIRSYTRSGAFLNDGQPNDFDLFMVDKSLERFINAYSDGSVGVYASKAEANAVYRTDRVALAHLRVDGTSVNFEVIG
jgi:hypothetical protein